jgi:hypothetical protein
MYLHLIQNQHISKGERGKIENGKFVLLHHHDSYLSILFLTQLLKSYADKNPHFLSGKCGV